MLKCEKHCYTSIRRLRNTVEIQKNEVTCNSPPSYSSPRLSVAKMINMRNLLCCKLDFKWLFSIAVFPGDQCARPIMTKWKLLLRNLLNKFTLNSLL